MMRSSSKSGFFEFFDSFHKELIGIDKSTSGFVCANGLKQLLSGYGVEAPMAEDVIKPFYSDSSGESVVWIELLAFLGCCYNWLIIRRVHQLHIIRKKQGNEKNALISSSFSAYSKFFRL